MSRIEFISSLSPVGFHQIGQPALSHVQRRKKTQHHTQLSTMIADEIAKVTAEVIYYISYIRVPCVLQLYITPAGIRSAACMTIIVYMEKESQHAYRASINHRLGFFHAG